ncbi:transposase [Cesiribacter sp. SM1]|uniref:transposase n=1 Tax=Cesiribacter sp. SM1 TaxID=2861196 RepID=UPI001CD6D3BE|nr:transposase [Cesiribacter sp. SM1]
MQKRRSFSAEFKVKVAFEALKEQQTLQELAQKYELHPNQISAWKQEFLEKSASVFSQGKKKEEATVDTGKLYEEIGRLKVEVDRPATRFLKKRV